MRICDKCDAKATERISFDRTKESVDLCHSCTEKTKEFIFKKVKNKKGKEKNNGRK